MRNRWKLFVVGVVVLTLFSGCGSDPKLSKFKSDIDNFCTDISKLDTSMNNIDATTSDAKEELLEYLDEVDMKFQNFAELDFPEEFDYLETLADEAGEYMKEAVEYYHEAYSNNGYNENTAAYAQENYSRAFKRVQIIISFLHGEEPEDVDLTIEPETEEE